ncbi:amino acid permease family protein, partial [Vibrio parahaemolyticus VP2007-007]
LCGLRLRIL